MKNSLSNNTKFSLLPILSGFTSLTAGLVLKKRSHSALRICLVDITACRQGRRDVRSSPLAGVLQPKKLLKSQLVLLKMPKAVSVTKFVISYSRSHAFSS